MTPGWKMVVAPVELPPVLLPLEVDDAAAVLVPVEVAFPVDVPVEVPRAPVEVPLVPAAVPLVAAELAPAADVEALASWRPEIDV